MLPTCPCPCPPMIILLILGKSCSPPLGSMPVESDFAVICGCLAVPLAATEAVKADS